MLIKLLLIIAQINPKFFAHLQAAPQRSKTVQPHSTESRDIREKCLDYIDFHVMYGDKTGKNYSN